MTRLLLRTLNAPGLVVLTALGIAIQTSLFSSPPLSYIQPDFVLLITLWCAFRRDFTEGGIITLIVSQIAETHSSAPQGLFLSTYMLLYLTIRSASKLFVIPDLASFLLITLFASVFWKLSGMGILALLGGSAHWQNTLLLLFPGAVVEAALGIWVYRWLERFDFITFKNRRTEDIDPVSGFEDEFRIESEGF